MFGAVRIFAGLIVAMALFGVAGISIASADAHIRIEHAWARPGIAAAAGASGKMGMAGNSAVYMEIHNTASSPDRLTAAASEAAAVVELHRTTMAGGMSRMARVAAIPVPARGRTELKPGGYHVMLIGLKRDLKVGDRVNVRLTFARGGTLTIRAGVRMAK
jgi:copper(I)-binding protein